MLTEPKRDYYQVLGVPRTATVEQIRTAFEKLAGAFRAAGKPCNIGDVEEIRAVATAYRVLSDTRKRKRYDQFAHLSIGDEHNTLVGRPDKLDELLAWIESRRKHSSDSGFLD